MRGRKKSRYEQKQDLWGAGIATPIIRPEKQVRPPASGEWDVKGVVTGIVHPSHVFLQTQEGERVFVEADVLPGGTQKFAMNQTLCCRTRRNHHGLYATRLLDPADVYD
jgi:hypothetical protein